VEFQLYQCITILHVALKTLRREEDRRLLPGSSWPLCRFEPPARVKNQLGDIGRNRQLRYIDA